MGPVENLCVKAKYLVLHLSYLVIAVMYTGPPQTNIIMSVILVNLSRSAVTALIQGAMCQLHVKNKINMLLGYQAWPGIMSPSCYARLQLLVNTLARAQQCPKYCYMAVAVFQTYLTLLTTPFYKLAYNSISAHVSDNSEITKWALKMKTYFDVITSEGKCPETTRKATRMAQIVINCTKPAAQRIVPKHLFTKYSNTSDIGRWCLSSEEIAISRPGPTGQGDDHAGKSSRSLRVTGTPVGRPRLLPR
ncbi:hypothetical protein CEXT_469561 [Caerostris extrusa]|uniref:Uncharacterized protein n=1 Tax=Caerostris extrusa TaxID=172846 RepID=A0AAV4W0J2_CAEEX|nr:hypothetical protein CEXT_469561 [Caerostris extrusa]